MGVIRNDSLEQARFEFGKNWQKYLPHLTDSQIVNAQHSLQDMLGIEDLSGSRFLDIGCGSGLFSLAARRLDASFVLSFDFDPDSVKCTEMLKQHYLPKDTEWVIQRGSVLDKEYLGSLQTFDVVYSWGVLHHTGNMWQAFANILPLVKCEGSLFIAIYNDQGKRSGGWRAIKRAYNGLPWLGRMPLTAIVFLRLWGPTFFKDLVAGRFLDSWRHYDKTRGMSPWRDVVDWVGGYPFEVAKPEEVIDFFRLNSFELTRLKTVGSGHGCNEYVFRRKD